MTSPPVGRPVLAAEADLFRALSHPARIRILELLVESNQTVGNLLADARLAPSTLSQHLAVMKRSGLVESSRKRNAVTYRVSDPSVGAFLRAARSLLASTLGRVMQTLDALEGPALTEQPNSQTETLIGPHTDRDTDTAAVRNGP